MKWLKRRKKLIIDKEKLEEVLAKWWEQVDEFEEEDFDEKLYNFVEKISVTAVLEFVGKVIDYCDIKKGHMTSDEIHAELCKKRLKNVDWESEK